MTHSLLSALRCRFYIMAAILLFTKVLHTVWQRRRVQGGSFISSAFASCVSVTFACTWPHVPGLTLQVNCCHAGGSPVQPAAASANIPPVLPVVNIIAEQTRWFTGVLRHCQERWPGYGYLMSLLLCTIELLINLELQMGRRAAAAMNSLQIGAQDNTNFTQW